MSLRLRNIFVEEHPPFFGRELEFIVKGWLQTMNYRSVLFVIWYGFARFD